MTAPILLAVLEKSLIEKNNRILPRLSWCLNNGCFRREPTSPFYSVQGAISINWGCSWAQRNGSFVGHKYRIP